VVRELWDNWDCTALDTGSPWKSGLAFHSCNRESDGLLESGFEYQGHSAAVDTAGLRQDRKTSAAKLGIAVDDKLGENGSEGDKQTSGAF
jgi:hypothetical protein